VFLPLSQRGGPVVSKFMAHGRAFRLGDSLGYGKCDMLAEKFYLDRKMVVGYSPWPLYLRSGRARYYGTALDGTAARS